MTSTVLDSRDVVLVAPEHDYSAADGISPEGIEVRDPEAYLILTESDRILTGESLAAVITAAADYLYPNRTADQLPALNRTDTRYPSTKPGSVEIDCTLTLTN